MKKHVFTYISLFVLSLNAICQDKINLVVFSEDGDAFYAYLNGIRQNDKPETNVRVTGVSPNISLRIEFENKALASLKQAGPLEPGFEHTLRIKKDSKNQLKLRYFGQTELGTAPSNGATSIAYHSTENTVTGENTSSSVNSSPNTITSTTTTTTRSTRGNTNGDNVSVNINMAGVGLNMNVSGVDDMNNTNTSTSSTTVTTTSSSSGSYNSNASSYNQNTQGNSSNSSTPSKAGCSSAMSAANFAKMKQSVEDKPFSDTKMSTAKVATKNACLSVNQVKEICKLFSMDDDKLAYAKYAYDYCVDKANYYQVSEVFSFSATTDDFNKFLEQ